MFVWCMFHPKQSSCQLGGMSQHMGHAPKSAAVRTLLGHFYKTSASLLPIQVTTISVQRKGLNDANTSFNKVPPMRYKSSTTLDTVSVTFIEKTCSVRSSIVVLYPPEATMNYLQHEPCHPITSITKSPIQTIVNIPCDNPWDCLQDEAQEEDSNDCLFGPPVAVENNSKENNEEVARNHPWGIPREVQHVNQNKDKVPSLIIII